MSVIAYHLIWTAYGTWLPNDPRGSGSTTPELAELGDAHLGRKKAQPSRAVVREFCAEAEERLSFSIIRFDEGQRSAIGESFGDIISNFKYTCYACAVLPDHVHLVIRKHRDDAEQMIGNFQGMSRAGLLKQALVPEEHPVWTKRGWKVFLDTPAEVRSRIAYVKRNPVKEGLPPQSWPFVVEYNNWPFHKRSS